MHFLHWLKAIEKKHGGIALSVLKCIAKRTSFQLFVFNLTNVTGKRRHDQRLKWKLQAIEETTLNTGHPLKVNNPLLVAFYRCFAHCIWSPKDSDMADDLLAANVSFVRSMKQHLLDYFKRLI